MSKEYDLEYKEYVCRMIVEEKRKKAELARELNISVTTLRRWEKEYEQKKGWVKRHNQKKKEQESPIYKTPADFEKELKEQEKEITRLSRENQILKKAMHVFTESQE